MSKIKLTEEELTLRNLGLIFTGNGATTPTLAYRWGGGTDSLVYSWEEGLPSTRELSAMICFVKFRGTMPCLACQSQQFPPNVTPHR